MHMSSFFVSATKYNIHKLFVGFKNQYSVRNIVNLSYKIFGGDVCEGEPPVILLHGLLGNKRHWNSVGKTIVNVTKRSVVAVDLRNHGSSPHVNSHKYEELAEDIVNLLTKLSIRRACLVGHSMGGKAAMCLALTTPEIVSGLLVIDISPADTKPILLYFPKILTSMKEITFKDHKHIADARHEAKKKLMDHIKSDLVMDVVLSNVNRKSDGVIGWSCNVDVLIKYIEVIASFPKKITRQQFFGPTLFLGGQFSDFLPADDLHEIRKMFPSAVISYVPQVGHNLHVEDPKTFLSLAISFIIRNK